MSDTTTHLKASHLEKHLYGRTICVVPAPKLIVFYNGTKEQPEEQVLNLSDSFPEGKTGDVEVTVHCININYAENKELLNSCLPLRDYSLFISLVRRYNVSMGERTAVSRAISALPDGIVKQYLETHRTEAANMFLAEYDEEGILLAHRREGYADGKAEGIAIGYYKMISKGRITVADAAEDLGLPEDDFLRNMSAAGYKVPEKI